VEYIAGTRRNPFGQNPPCDTVVAGYGVTTADFHVVGDHPGVHGGRASGIPFTGHAWSQAFFEALRRGGVVDRVDLETDTVDGDRAFFSYLHMCDPGENAPSDAEYATLEPFFDAELRAITADVLLPVGERATAHVLRNYTARSAENVDMTALHGTELQGAGWLVVPVADPAGWSGREADRLVAGLRTLQQTDYRRLADLGRFSPDEDPYFVR
jgi:uracil-DNA glycosylase